MKPSTKQKLWGVLRTIARAVSLGLIGRGRKTKEAGDAAGELLDNIKPKE